MRSRPSSSKVAPASRRSHAGRNPQSINRHNEFRSFAFAVRVRVYLDLHMKTRFAVQLATVLFLLFVPSVVRADSLDDLASDFWAWRAAEQPVSSDDIPRIERPSGWVPDWSPEAVARYHKQLDEYEMRWQKIDASTWPIPRQVDYRLMGSALSRVRWELDRIRNWQRDPSFYVQQTVGTYLQLLLPPPPFDSARSKQIVATLASIPRTLASANQNLTEPAAPFARIALSQLQDIRSRLLKSVARLKPLLDAESSRDLDSVAEQAAVALESYRDWLTQRLATMRTETAIGRDNMFSFSRVLRCFHSLPSNCWRWANRNGRDPSHHRFMKSTAMQAFPTSGYSKMSPSRSLRSKKTSWQFAVTCSLKTFLPYRTGCSIIGSRPLRAISRDLPT